MLLLLNNINTDPFHDLKVMVGGGEDDEMSMLRCKIMHSVCPHPHP